MATNINKVMDEYVLAWNSHDVNKLLSFFTDDGVFEEVTYGIVNHGKKEITAHLNSMFVDYPDLKKELKSAFGGW